jgi:hypothetical protein
MLRRHNQAQPVHPPSSSSGPQIWAEESRTAPRRKQSQRAVSQFRAGPEANNIFLCKKTSLKTASDWMSEQTTKALIFGVAFLAVIPKSLP